MFGDFADGLCVSGAAAGAEPDDVILSRVHEVAKPRKVPVFVIQDAITEMSERNWETVTASAWELHLKKTAYLTAG